MISPAEIQHWRNRVPWTADDQVEQDLILARLMIEIANDPLLGVELVMRGGTCFHMLWLDRPWRYSEDLDYVRRSEGPVGPILDALRLTGERVGFDKTSTAIGRHPKAHMHSTFASGNRLRVKVEMNTFERSPALPTTVRSLAVDSPWFNGSAEVPTFAIEELTATKIRAIYQRSKGRDLFDLWLAVHLAGVQPASIAQCFAPYRPDGWTPGLALNNLEAKLSDHTFTSDIDGLLVDRPNGYDGAAQRVIVVSCKAWQAGFDATAKLDQLKKNKVSGRDAWRFFRELWMPKWAEACVDKIEGLAGQRTFDYRIAVTSLRSDIASFTSDPTIGVNLPGCNIAALRSNDGEHRSTERVLRPDRGGGIAPAPDRY